MKHDLKKRGSRREFLRLLGRYPLFFGLLAMGGFLANRKPCQDTANCLAANTCGQCQAASLCSLPKAKDFRSQSTYAGNRT